MGKKFFTLVQPPSLTSDLPQQKTVKENGKMHVSVHAEGTDLSYQWLRDGAPLRGEDDHYHGVTTPSLTISQASLDHSGEYQCMVENEEGSVTSSSFKVKVGESV